MISLEEQQAALALINARRAAAGLTALPGFASYTPPVIQPIDPLLPGQALLEKRRCELGIKPLSPTPLPQRGEGQEKNSGSSSPFPRSGEGQKIHSGSCSPFPARRGKGPGDRGSFPTHIHSWPQITLRASRCGASGAIRAWELARALDPAGRGWVARTDLLHWLEQLAVSRSTRNRWVRRAVELGLLRKARQNTRLLYASLARAAILFEVQDPGERVSLPAAQLAARDWKSSAWTAALTRFQGPVSRATLQQVTGIQSRCQRNYERRFKAQHEGLRVTPNYAIDGLHGAPELDGYREFRRRHAFLVNVAGSQQIAFRLPNTYHVDPAPSTSPDCIRTAGGRYRSWQIRLMNATQVVVSEFSGRGAQQAVVSLTSEAQPMRHPAGDPAGRDRSAACRVGDANPGGRRRRYFERYRSLRRALRRMRAGKRPAGEVYEFMAGGIARKPRIYPKCRWWHLVGE